MQAEPVDGRSVEPRRLDPPDYDERIIVVGSNGSGKTVFCQQLLGAGYPSTVSVDLKGDFQHPHPDAELVTDPRDARLDREGRPDKPVHLVYRPAAKFRTRDWLEYFFARMLRRAHRQQPFILYVDEGLAVGRMRAVRYLSQIWVMGRSLNCGAWIASQRLAWIPIETRSEAHRWYVFYLGDPEDEKLVVRHAKGELELEELRAATHSYGFVELRRGANSGGRVGVREFGPVMRTQHHPRRR